MREGDAVCQANSNLTGRKAEVHNSELKKAFTTQLLARVKDTHTLVGFWFFLIQSHTSRVETSAYL